MLDTKSFFSQTETTQPLISKETLSHFLSTLSHFIPSDRTGAAAMWRRGGSETQGVEWLSIGASGWNGGDMEVRGSEARWIRVVVGRSQGGDVEARLVRSGFGGALGLEASWPVSTFIP
jgi:hypothetical protein